MSISPIVIISAIVLAAMVVIILAGRYGTPHLQRLLVVSEMSIAFCAIAVYAVIELDNAFDQGQQALESAISLIVMKVIILAGAVLVSGCLLLHILKKEEDEQRAG